MASRHFPAFADRFVSSSRWLSIAQKLMAEENDARERAQRHAAFQAEAEAFRLEKGG